AQVGRRQVVERVAAEEASPAHDPSVLGAVAAEVAEVEAAFALDEARARRGSTLHPRNLDGDRDDRMEPAGRSGLRHPRRVREHRYTLDFPHPPERVWALMQDYDRWTVYAPMVIRVEVLHPGDAQGNGLLRRVIYQMPFGRTGAAIELVTEVQQARGYTYRMIGRESGNDQTGR